MHQELLRGRICTISALLEQEKVHPVLIGGCALAVYGIPTKTTDIDLLVDCGLRKLRRILRVLRAKGYRMDVQSEAALRERDLVSFRCFAGGVQIDLIPASSPRLQQVHSQAWRQDWRGTMIRTARLVDVVVEKLRTGRTAGLSVVTGLNASVQGETQLTVRNLEEEVARELKLRAARHGRSAEAEHREILRAALLPAREERSLKEFLLAMPEAREDADFERVPDCGRDVEL